MATATTDYTEAVTAARLDVKQPFARCFRSCTGAARVATIVSGEVSLSLASSGVTIVTTTTTV